MYRVLIVDDEKMIRMGMKNAIDWKKLGVDDVFTAASGNEALKILKEEGPEIMVTDIQMTEMTGLELIKAARESVPELRVIVLTGFDNFEYARESLRLQVQDFFLKPIDEDDLFNAIEKQIKELKEQENKEQNQARVLIFFIAVILIPACSIADNIIQMTVDIKIAEDIQILKDGRKIFPVGFFVTAPLIKGRIVGIPSVADMGRSYDEIKRVASGIPVQFLLEMRLDSELHTKEDLDLIFIFFF